LLTLIPGPIESKASCRVHRFACKEAVVPMESNLTVWL
jgi:hypothetical protein